MSLGDHKVFNPRNHQIDLVSAFTRYQRKFGYVYDGENRSPPSAIVDPAQILEWRERDKARLFLSRAVSDEFLDDYEAAVPEASRVNIKFSDLVEAIKKRYTPTSNTVHNHYLFHRIVQKENEPYDDFCHHVRSEAELCNFKCDSPTCTVKDVLICDQILVGTNSESLRSEALRKQWGLEDLLKEGRVTESSLKAASEIKSEPSSSSSHYGVNRARVGPYSSKSKAKSDKPSKSERSTKFLCWKCEDTKCAGYNKCKYHGKECKTCKKTGHAPRSRLCPANKKKFEKHDNRSGKKKTNRTRIQSDDESSDEEDDSSSSEDDLPVRTVKANSLNILAVKVDRKQLMKSCNSASIRGGQRRKPRKASSKKDFHTEVIINGAPVVALVDTGAEVSVMSKAEAKLIGLKWDKSKIKLHPYGSKPIKICGIYQGPVKFNDNVLKPRFILSRNHKKHCFQETLRKSSASYRLMSMRSKAIDDNPRTILK